MAEKSGKRRTVGLDLRTVREFPVVHVYKDGTVKIKHVDGSVTVSDSEGRLTTKD